MDVATKGPATSDAIDGTDRIGIGALFLEFSPGRAGAAEWWHVLVRDSRNDRDGNDAIHHDFFHVRAVDGEHFNFGWKCSGHSDR